MEPQAVRPFSSHQNGVSLALTLVGIERVWVDPCWDDQQGKLKQVALLSSASRLSPADLPADEENGRCWRCLKEPEFLEN